MFSHVCLRKLYVLCSRGGSLQGSQKHLLQIAQVRGGAPAPYDRCCARTAAPLRSVADVPYVVLQAAFPIILVRCRSILQQFAADQRSDPGSVDSQRMEEVVCVLEVRHSNDEIIILPYSALLCFTDL